MKYLCITGAAQSDLDQIAGILHAAGMSPAAASKRDAAVDIAYWHEQVLARLAADEDEESTAGPKTAANVPGRLWEQLATDIFLANTGAAVWGWATTRSLSLLDFWRGFEPKLNFILVCTRPERLVARLINAGSSLAEITEEVQAWHARHEAMLRFHLRHPQRSVLIDAGHFTEHPRESIRLLNSRWKKLGLNEAAVAESAAPGADALAQHLARQLLEPFGELTSLQQELEATMPAVAGNGGNHDAAVPLEQLITNYRQLQDRSRELLQMQTLRGDLAALEQRLQETTVKALEQQQDLQQENDLLLSQLHQVQEEFEALFLKQEAAGKERELLKQEKAALNARVTNLQNEQTQLIKARDEQTKLASDRQAVITQLTAVRDEQTKLASDRQTVIAQLTAVRDEQTKLAKERQALITQLTAVRDEQTKLALERQEEIELLGQAKTVLEEDLSRLRASPPQNKAQIEALHESGKRLDEYQQRNELLLLQLHQVQDELNNYFQQHQDARKQLAEAEERYQRLLQSNPESSDIAAVQLLENKEGICTWLLRDVLAAGRSLKELRLQTLVANGYAGFVITREANGQSPLLRWPGTETQRQITLLPSRDQAELQAFAALAVNLSTSDWQLLQTCVRVLEEALENDAVGKLPADFDPHQTLRKGLRALASAFNSFPEVLRHDSLALKREQVNPDYEHLWLQFRNLSLGKEHWSAFEFRLSCAHVGPRVFGQFPKLEFPEESGAVPFDSWFVEAHDDFGVKLELRFVIEPDSLDAGTWQKLSQHDQRFVGELLKLLPVWLNTLEHSGDALQRPWQDWQQMVRDMQRVLQQVTQPVLPPAVEPEVEKETIQKPANEEAVPKTPSDARKPQTKRKTR